MSKSTEAVRRWRLRHPEERKKRRREWKEKNPDLVRASHTRVRKNLKRCILEHYGGTPPSCACCGENIYEFLTIDHINGGGAVHRRELKREGNDNIFAWLKRNGYPEGFRILCMNCNWAIGLYGSCPHSRENKQLELDSGGEEFTCSLVT